MTSLRFILLRAASVGLLLALLATAAEAAGPVAVQLRFEPATVSPGTTAVGLVVFSMEPGFHIYGPLEGNGLPTRVVVEAPTGVTTGAVEFPSPVQKNYALLGGALALYEGEVVVRFPVTVAPGARESSLEFVARVDYQPCTDKLCRRPVHDFPVRGVLRVASGAAPSKVATHPEATPALAPGPQSPSPIPHPPSPPPRHDAFQDALSRGLLFALLAAFGWGIAASLSPCVYPMIPFTIGYFGRQARDGGRGRKVALALAFVAGMSFTYAVLGILAARLGRDLGSWMVNPWVIGLLCLLLVLLALSMFGFFVLQLPAAVTRRFEAGERGGFLEAAFMGLAMGFVAAPCVGPFAGSILVFVARSGDLVTGFLTLFSFGLGMGMLFLVLAVSSGSLAALPRSGGWLLKLEHFFGYVMLGMALYLLSNVVPAWFSLWAAGVYLVLGGAYLGAFSPVAEGAGGWDLMAKGVGFLGVLMGAAAVLAGLAGGGFLGAIPSFPEAGAAGGVAPAESGWVRSMDEALAQARSTGRPVFADFYADWCIPCTQMSKNVFPSPAVVAALAPFVRAKVDCTQSDSPGARYKNEVLKATSMPYLAFFDPEGRPLPDDSIEGYTDEATLVAALTKVSVRYAVAATGR